MALMAMVLPVWAQTFGYSVNVSGPDEEPQPLNHLWRINLETGEGQRIGALRNDFVDLEALALSAVGVLFGADDSENTLLRISRNSGFAQPLPVDSGFQTGNMGLSGMFDFGMSFDCSGQLFVVSPTKETLYTANLETGRLTEVGPAGTLGAPITDLAIRGDRAYGIGVGSNSDGTVRSPNLYRLNLVEPSAELIGPLVGPDGDAVGQYNNAGLSFAANGTLWAMTDRNAVIGQEKGQASQVLRINPRTGEAEIVAETSIGSEALVGLKSLAVDAPSGCNTSAPDGNPYSVPVMSRPGVLVLCFLVLALAWLRLRFQNS